jgi:hypothetical protein
MIIEYSIEDLRNYYNDDLNINNDYEELETILSDKIDEDVINSDIIHIFPIILSSTLTLIATMYFLI